MHGVILNPVLALSNSHNSVAIIQQVPRRHINDHPAFVKLGKSIVRNVQLDLDKGSHCVLGSTGAFSLNNLE